MSFGEHMYMFLWGVCPGVELIDHNGSVVRIHLSVQETWAWSLGWEDSLEKEMAVYASIVAWEILWTGQPGGLPSLGLQKN